MLQNKIRATVARRKHLSRKKGGTKREDVLELGPNALGLTSLPQIKLLIEILNEAPVTAENLLSLLQSNNDDKKLEFLVENQRGMKLFGIPLFSDNSLFPLIDPSSYQSVNGKHVKLSYNNVNNYTLPDLGWEWEWPNWYVLMFDDVDEHGWIYSKVFFGRHYWKGKYHVGNFVRRRVWVRLRHRTESWDSNVDHSVE